VPDAASLGWVFRRIVQPGHVTPYFTAGCDVSNALEVLRVRHPRHHCWAASPDGSGRGRPSAGRSFNAMMRT
jgi:hypothetical protein